MTYPLPVTQLIEKTRRFQFKSLLTFPALSFATDLFILNISFFVFYYLKTSALALTQPYFQLLLLFNLTWLVVSLLSKKFRREKYAHFQKAVFTIVKTSAAIAYLLSFMVIVLEFFTFSRAQVFGTCILYGVVQLNWFTVYFLVHGKKIKVPKISRANSLTGRYPFSLRRFIANFLLVTGAFYLMNYYKRGTFELSSEYEKALLMIYGIWFIASIYTGKFSRRKYPNFVYAIAPYIKALIISIALLSVTIFLFRLFFYSRLQIFGTFFLVGMAEIMLYFLYSDLPLRQRKEADIETVEETESIFRQETLPVRNPVSVREETDFVPAHDKLKEHYLKDWPNLYQFLSQNVDLSEIDNSETIVLNTHTLFNVETIENNSLTLFINLDLINDIRRINQYFLEVHKKFYNGSYFVGRAETIDTHHSKIFSKYPGSFAEVIYALDFLIFRVLPKIPLINRLYFLITRGKNRVISKAEILGRLYFCGFKVSATREIGDNFYFIACKIKNPAVDRNPSYGPLIKLRRIGYDGRIISVNKFRTMHPYSEYLQDYIYEQNHLQSNGKFNNDFRVTAWGRVFRKMWIDELPQLANFFRGDLSLVGVRALSPHYFKLYPRDLQDLRVKFKPGLVPPYYADMPDSFAEIVDSERTYLLAKQQKPFTTDIKYFCKAMYNIFFNNARSR